jgi:hypothetical protein
MARTDRRTSAIQSSPGLVSYSGGRGIASRLGHRLAAGASPCGWGVALRLGRCLGERLACSGVVGHRTAQLRWPWMPWAAFSW